MVNTVGHMLGLEAEGILLCLRITALKGMLCIGQEISGIELNTGLIGQHVHSAAAVGIVHTDALNDLFTRSLLGEAEATINFFIIRVPLSAFYQA